MNSDWLESVVAVMQSQGIGFAAGLSDAEISRAEAAHRFRFPADLRALLQHAQPMGDRFPDWREPESAFILDRLSWPADSMCFDIEHDAFWMPEWGRRPEDLGAANAVARAAVRKAPFLIPVFAHRYLPAMPLRPGNPIFSVWQTDIIYYGFDLASWLEKEFGVPNPLPAPSGPREIELWSELERRN
ncbi:MAG TPA: SMI1/KNR4 family protein [Planctomycetota bacterium]